MATSATHSSTARSFIDTYAKEMNQLLMLKHLMDRSAGQCISVSNQIQSRLLEGEAIQPKINAIVKEMLAYRKQERLAKETARNLIEKTRIFTQLPLPTGDATSEEAAKFIKIRDQITPLLPLLAANVTELIDRQVIPTWNRAKDLLEAALSQIGTRPGLLGAVQGQIPTYLGGKWPRVEIALEQYEKAQTKLPETPKAAAAPAAPEQPPTFAEQETALQAMYLELKTHIETYPMIGHLKPPPPAQQPPKSYAAAVEKKQ